MSEKKEKDFLIIGSYNYANRRILHELRELGKQAKILAPERLLPFINNYSKDRMYVMNGDDAPEQITKQNTAAIIPRIGGNLQFYAKSIHHIQDNIGIPTTSNANGLLDAQDKIRTVQILSTDGIKTPKTIAIKHAQNVAFMVRNLGGFPIVGKTLFGSQGIGVFILETAKSASTVLDAFTSQGHALLLQQFIETEKKNGRGTIVEKRHDFRAVVVNGEVVASIKRNATGDDFRTNASLKEDCEGVELDKEMTQLAIDCAKSLDLACAGVDIARDAQTNELYVYEVNGNFNFKSTEKYSKKNVGLAIAKYAISLADAQNKSEKNTNQTVTPLRLFSGTDKGIKFLDDDDNEESPTENKTRFASSSVDEPVKVMTALEAFNKRHGIDKLIERQKIETEQQNEYNERQNRLGRWGY
jgi:ribosomal protein S6--L-glutamate ligase